MSKDNENHNGKDELAETDLDQVSGGLGNFNIQRSLKDDGVPTDEGPRKPDPSEKGLVFENVTVKY